MFRRPAHGRLVFLDDLRALAILAVFATHATELLRVASPGGDWLYRMCFQLNLGRVGVVTFFAVSGFLIPSSLRGSVRSGSIRFVITRFFRLYPVFWVTVIPSVATFFWLMDNPISWAQILDNLTMLPRLFDAPFANGGYWTLQVELLFYAICFFLFIGGVIYNQFVVACLMFANFFFFYSSQREMFGGALNPALGPDTFYLCLNLSCMFWGSVCRFWWDEGKLQPVPLLFFSVFTFYWLIYSPFMVFWHWHSHLSAPVDMRLQAGYGVGIAFFFILLVTGLKLGRFMSWIGRISYSLYLIQGPIIMLFYYFIPRLHLGGGRSDLIVLLAFAATLPFAEALNRFVERPSNALGRHIAKLVTGTATPASKQKEQKVLTGSGIPSQAGPAV